MKKLVTTTIAIIALCVAFMIGSLAGYSLNNRYELVTFPRDQGGGSSKTMAYRIDKLTGQMWQVQNMTSYCVEEFKEQTTP